MEPQVALKDPGEVYLDTVHPVAPLQTLLFGGQLFCSHAPYGERTMRAPTQEVVANCRPANVQARGNGGHGEGYLPRLRRGAGFIGI